VIAGLTAGLGVLWAAADLLGVVLRGGEVGAGTARERTPPDVELPVAIAGTFENRKLIL